MTHSPQPREVFGWRFTTPMLIGAALNPVNTSVIVTALAPIANAFGVEIGSTAVLIAALYAASAVSQPVLGRIAVQYGARRVLIAGLVITALGGLIGGLGTSLAQLTIARIVIGVGSSACYPASIMLIRQRADAAGIAEPGRVLGAISMASQVTIALGLPLGGLLVDFFGWRIVFLLNAPLTLAAVLMSWRSIPRDTVQPSPRRRDRLAAIDIPGVFLFGTGLTAVLVFLISLPTMTWAALATGVITLTILLAWEIRTPSPLLDIRMLMANRGLGRTYIRFSLACVATYCLLYGLTQWLQAGRGLNGSVAGLLMLPMYIVALGASWIAAGRNLVRFPLIVAAVLAIGVSIALRLTTSSSALTLIVAIVATYGITVSLTAVGNQGALYAQAPASDIGTAVGLSRTFLHTGAIVSSAIMGLIYAQGVDDAALHTLATILIGTSAVVMILTVIDGHLPRRLSGRPA